MNFGTMIKAKRYAWFIVIILGILQFFSLPEVVTVILLMCQAIALVMIITIHLVIKGLRSDLQSLYIFHTAIIMEYIKPTSLAMRKKKPATYNYMDLYVSMMTDFFDLIMKEVDYNPEDIATMRSTGFMMKENMPKDNEATNFIDRYDRTKELEREKNDIM